MAKDWIMIRVSRETHRQLQAVRASMMVADLAGQIELARDDRDRVSLDQVIERLIAFRERHAQRRQKAASKKPSKADPIAAGPE